jgi:hypothetical protein
MRIERGPANSQNATRRNELCRPRHVPREFVEELTGSITTN